MARPTDISTNKAFAVGGRDPTREELALREIGVTRVSRRVAAALVAAFLASIVFVPSLQLWRDLATPAGTGRAGRAPQMLEVFGIASRGVEAGVRSGGSPWKRLMAANGAALAAIVDFEDALEDESVFANAMLPPTQEMLLRLGAGNEKVYLGEDGWLFYRPDVDYVTGPGFLEPSRIAERMTESPRGDAVRADPIPAIVDFQRQLAARGIELIVAPAPSKASILPARFSSSAAGVGLPLGNPSFDRFVRELRAAGVSVFDSSPRLLEAGGNAYLRTDTHWTPGAMDRVAADLAAAIERRIQFSTTATPGLQTASLGVAALGDIAAMLRLPDGQRLIEPERVSIDQVHDEQGDFWRPSREAEVLLLGDSFSNIFSLAQMGWGESAGLAERLSFHLQRPLDAIRRNDNGSFATREALARDLGRGIDRLAGKRVVVWEFASRELATGNWKEISLALGEPPPRAFVVPPEGERWMVTGVVEQISEAPRPGSVPYKDHIIALHLGDLERLDGDSPGRDAVVYLTSMMDNVWTAAARLREGAAIRLELRPWSEVAPDLERINRSELADVELQFEEPCWGELINE